MTATKFAIGAEEWPGISKLVEESGEVQQVCGKLIATYGKEEHWEGSNLRTNLEEELGDLLAAIHFVIRRNRLNSDAITSQSVDKEAQFEEWHEARTADRLR